MVNIIDNTVTEYIIKVILAFLVGALIGLERERTRIVYTMKSQQSSHKSYSLPGIRSFGLLSLYGMLLAYTPSLVNNTVIQLIVEIFLIALIYTVFVVYIYRRAIMAKTTGITTYLVISISIILGYMVGVDKILEAISTSMFVTLILAVKPSISRFVREITYNELLSGLELGLFVFVLGPFFIILHPTIYGIDLSKFYILFVIILALSYVSYIAVRIKGSEALRYIALLGGLVNSEAATSNIVSIISRQNNIDSTGKAKITGMYLSMIISAMVLRNIVITLVLVSSSYNLGEILWVTALLFLSIIIPFIKSVWVFFRGKEPYIGGIEVSIENPLSYSTAVKVVLAYSIIFVLSFMTSIFLPEEFMILLSFFGGFVNAGATILSIITISQIEGYSLQFIVLLIIIANIGAATNKIVFVRMVSREPSIIKATIKTIIHVLISSIIPLVIIWVYL